MRGAGHVQSAVRVPLFVAATAAGYGRLLAWKWIRRRPVEEVTPARTHWWAKWCCRIAGIRVCVHHGSPAANVLFAPNHIGYCDVFALAALVPCFFVTRTEMLDWPVAGAVIRAAGEPHVERASGRGLAIATRRIEELLRGGHSVCAYLEGTSTGGDRFLPFNASLLKSAVKARVPVQPVAMLWTANDSTASVQEHIAYWKDHAFGPHVWKFFGLGGMTAHVAFGEPMRPEDGLNRADFAESLRGAVLQLHDCLSGRLGKETVKR